MKYYNLKDKKYYSKKRESAGLKFLYNTILGRFILKIFLSKFIRNSYNKFMDSRTSKYKIKKFIKKNNIDITRYEERDYLSFNDFFKRKIKRSNLIIEDGLFAIADSKLSVLKINDESTFKIKNSLYTIDELILEDYDCFKGGLAFIYRLSVDDYHRYLYLDDGKVLRKKTIPGTLHTVQPIALKKYKVFLENSREVTFIETKNYGTVCYVEVGAMMIGKIVNREIDEFKRGEEKGHFEFGGSTIILLFERDKVKPNKILIENTLNDIENIVKIGSSLE